jgi:hypothetical protein
MGDNTTDDGGLGDQPAEEVQGEAASGRRTREDLKELVLNAGVEVLERDGLGLSIGSLTYAKVFAYIQENYGITVSRASVHERIWESRDEFRNAVVARAMAYSSTEVLEPVTENLNELLGGLELSTRDGRDQAVRDLLRHALSLNWEFAMGSTAARRQIAVKAMCLTEADPDLRSNGKFICFLRAVPSTSSEYGATHPPYAKPPLISSSGPPGACMTPSREICSSTITFLMTNFL